MLLFLLTATAVDLVRTSRGLKTLQQQHFGLKCNKDQYCSGPITFFSGCTTRCLPCGVDPDGSTPNGLDCTECELQTYTPSADGRAVESQDPSHFRKGPSCLACPDPSAQVLMLDEIGRKNCFVRDYPPPTGSNDLCSAAIQSQDLPEKLRPLQRGAIWDVSWDGGKTFEEVPVHLNDLQALLDGGHITKEQRLKDYGLRKEDYTPDVFKAGAHIVMLSFFPKYGSLDHEALTLVAGASRALGVRNFVFLLGPGDHLLERRYTSGRADPGFLSPVSGLTKLLGQAVQFKFTRPGTDMDRAVDAPRVRLSVSQLKALGACVELLQASGGTPPLVPGQLARETLEETSRLHKQAEGRFRPPEVGELA